MLQNNPKQFWKAINPNHSKPICLYDEHNCPIPVSDVARKLNSTFCSAFTKEPDTELPNFPFYDHPIMPGITFEANGILKLIESLKLTSSSGVDGINSKILKNTKHISSIILSLIFQQSLSSGVVPQDWKVGKIIPVPKKGNPSSQNSYRPISLTSISCKLMEHVIYSHITKFLTSLNFFHPNQHGFLKGLSCDTQLASFINDLSTNLDQNVPVDSLFLDFEKAFDKVPHNRLFLKLSRLNLDPAVFAWLQNFLTNRKQFVFANSHSSSLSPVLSGVPQGTVLGPLLFLIYINDLPTNIQSNIRLFADDCVLYRPIYNSNDNIILQRDLNIIKNWCDTWLMSLNFTKTSAVSFHRRPAYISHCYVIGNCNVSSVKTYKYLGVTLTQDLTWTTHITNVTNDSNRVLGYLRRNLRFCSTSVKLLTYQTLIRPKLEYACAIWDPHLSNLSNTLESVQNRAARFIFSDYSYHTSVTNLKSQANLPLLETRRKVRRLCLFHKFYHSGTAPNVIKEVHRHSDRVHHPGKTLTSAHQNSFS